MLTIHEHGPIAEIALDRPPVNAMNPELIDELTTVHADLVAAGARGVAISGRDGLFSAGLDVPELLQLDRAQVEQFWNGFFRLMSAIAASAVPVAAAITGHAPAGGAVLALHCDYRVATRGDFYLGLNEVQVGLPVPPNILFILTEVLGVRRAALLAMQGKLLSPEDALREGLVDALADNPGSTRDIALEWLQGLLDLPPVAMNTTRLVAKAALIDRASANEDYAVTATDYWFSDETQAMMRKLVDDLAAS